MLFDALPSIFEIKNVLSRTSAPNCLFLMWYLDTGTILPIISIWQERNQNFLLGRGVADTEATDNIILILKAVL